MSPRFRLTLLAASLFTSAAAFATNGDTMMAVGSQNTALGGTGVAHFVGAESTFANPALLGQSTGREINGGLVIFRPAVDNTGFTQTTPAGSSATTNYIPDVSYSSRISDNLSYGIAMAGIAGMGVNYTGASAFYVKAKTTLSILKIVPTIAYNRDNYGIGFSPVLQYGSLAISYDTTGNPGGGPRNPAHNANTNTGLGYSLGGYYNALPELTLAAAYNAAIKMRYGTQLSAAGVGFGQVFADKLDQPAEVKAGVSYKLANSYTLTADYRLIQWGSAAGYREFGWKDQNVVAVGGKYAGEGYWLGIGYNHANNPISVFANGVPANATNGQNGVGNMFNNLMFPAIVKSSYTIGGGYSLSKSLDLDASLVFSPKVTSRVDISDSRGMVPNSLFNTTTHSQQSYSASLRYKF